MSGLAEPATAELFPSDGEVGTALASVEAAAVCVPDVVITQRAGKQS